MEVDRNFNGSDAEEEPEASRAPSRKRTRASTTSQAVPDPKKRKTLASLDAEGSDDEPVVPKSKGKKAETAPDVVSRFLFLLLFPD